MDKVDIGEFIFQKRDLQSTSSVRYGNHSVDRGIILNDRYSNHLDYGLKYFPEAVRCRREDLMIL